MVAQSNVVELVFRRPHNAWPASLKQEFEQLVNHGLSRAAAYRKCACRFECDRNRIDRLSVIGREVEADAQLARQRVAEQRVRNLLEKSWPDIDADKFIQAILAKSADSFER